MCGSVPAEFCKPGALFCKKMIVDCFELIFIFLKKGRFGIRCSVKHGVVRCERIEWFADDAFIEDRSRNADRAADIEFVGVKQNFCLDRGRRIPFPVAVGADTVADFLRKFFRKAVFG